MRSKLTYANVMSSLAVFLVLAGGGAYAAKKLGKNSVKTKSIKNRAVTEAKIADQAVTSPKLGDRAVATGKLGDKSVKHGKLGELAVENDKIAAGAVSAGKTDFLVTSGRKAVNRTADGTESVPLLSIAGVTVSGKCTEGGGGNDHTAILRIGGDANGFYIGTEARDAGGSAVQVASSLNDDVGQGATDANQLSFSTVTVTTPATTVHLDMSANVERQGADCLFAAVATAG